MNYEIKSLLQSEKPAIDNENGKLWQIKNAVLLHGNFLLWNNFVIKESLHENFSPSWIKYWLKERGETFGGKKSDQVKLVNRGKTRISKCTSYYSKAKLFRICLSICI